MDTILKKINLQIVLTYTTLVIVTIIGLYAVQQLDIAYPVRVTSAYPTTEFSVTGEGKVEVIPDTATINAGITVSAAQDVATVQKQINEVNNKIIAGMKDLSISKKDIQTSEYSIYPNYNYENGQKIDGYMGNATVSIKTHRLDQVQNIFSKLTEAGANQIQGVTFSVDDMTKVRVKARTRAIDDAKKQAQQLAKDSGIKLGKITNIIESPGPEQYPPYMAKSYAGGGDVAEVSAPDATIEPGSQTISSTVTLFFEKK